MNKAENKLKRIVLLAYFYPCLYFSQFCIHSNLVLWLTMSSPPTIETLSVSINQSLQNQQTFQSKIADNITSLTSEVNNLKFHLSPPGFPTPILSMASFPATSIKLDIPRFNGSDPLGWRFKITQFFDYHLTPDEQRLLIASFYMEGKALTWF